VKLFKFEESFFNLLYKRVGAAPEEAWEEIGFPMEIEDFHLS
jgi:hypothetical protein